MSNKQATLGTRLGVRVSTEKAKRLKTLAEDLGCTLSDILRAAIETRLQTCDG